jgi:hypothetical protein
MIAGDVLYHVAGGALTVLPLSAIAWYFWAYPDEWRKFCNVFWDSFGGPPQPPP